MFRNIQWWLRRALIIILLCGALLTAWSVHQEDARLREELFIKAKIAANGIPLTHVRLLQGSEADLVSPGYVYLKTLMTGITAVDKTIRFAYIMGKRADGQIFFYVDSEPPDSEDYSPPGQAYQEATILVRNAFDLEKPLTGGPDSDRWGTWVSAMIPLRDPETGALIGVYGMDLDARDWYASLMLAAAPEVLGTLLLLVVIMAFLFVSERKQRETELLSESRRAIQASEERYRLIFNSSPLGIVQLDSRGIIVTANKKFADFMGVSVDDLVGFDSLAQVENKGLHSAVRDMLAGNQANFEGEYASVLSGKRTHLRMLGGPLMSDDGKVTGAISIFEDITDRKHTEDALLLANKKLNLLNDITRHDILNQLMALKGFLELSREHPDDPERLRYFLDRASGAADTIEHQISFTRDYQDMGVKAAAWQDLNACIVRAKGALPVERFTLELADTQYEIFADPLFEKVFYNLLDNSLKHGGVHLSRVSISAMDTGRELVITYQDDGAGIPPHVREYLFEQVPAGKKGLGMLLASQILAITGITICEVGTFAGGARFEIRVPAGGYRRK